MKFRKNSSRFFGIGGPKHPHVLDLRAEEEKVPRRRKATLKESIEEAKEQEEGVPTAYAPPPVVRKPLSKDTLLEELEGIDDRDELLASGLETPPAARRHDSWRSGGTSEVRAEFAPQLIPRDMGASFSEGQSSSPSSSELSLPARVTRGGKTESIGNKEGGVFKFRNIRAFTFFAGTLAIVLFGSFFIQKGLAVKSETTAKGVLAYENFLAAEAALTSLNFEGASKDFSYAYENLASAEESLEAIGGITVSIVESLPFESRAGSSIALLRAAKHIAKAGETLSSAFTLLPLDNALSVETLLGMFTEGEGEGETSYLIDVFGVFGEYLMLAETELTQAKYEMAKVRAADFPEEFRGSILELRQKIPTLLEIVGASYDYSRISALLLGAEAPKRYLILFQNSSELRPTGGFIGSYALVEVDRGKLTSLLVEGIYNADGKLTVNVVPPEPFQHIATAWSTHDANWFLDFPTTARKVSWFYEQTGGGKIDGVVTLNVEVIEQLLGLTGPIQIGQYDLTLDAENFRDEIQNEVEAAYDRKLNRPKQILTDFAPIFLETLLGTAKESKREVISIFIKALDEKLIMFYFDDEDVQGFFENQGWTGSIQNFQPSDYLAVVHSNIGGHKTSKYMQDEIDHRAEIQDDGSIIGHLTITRTHTGGNTKYWWYNRDNIDYVKVYVPNGAEIISYSGAQRRDVRNPVDYASLPFTEDPDIAAIEGTLRTIGPIDVFTESGATVFGTWLVTKAGRSSELAIRYKLPFGVEFVNGVAKYNLYLQKQPGTRFQAASAVTVPDITDTVRQLLLPPFQEVSFHIPCKRCVQRPAAYRTLRIVYLLGGLIIYRHIENNAGRRIVQSSTRSADTTLPPL